MERIDREGSFRPNRRETREPQVTSPYLEEVGHMADSIAEFLGPEILSEVLQEMARSNNETDGPTIAGETFSLEIGADGLRESRQAIRNDDLYNALRARQKPRGEG